MTITTPSDKELDELLDVTLFRRFMKTGNPPEKVAILDYRDRGLHMSYSEFRSRIVVLIANSSVDAVKAALEGTRDSFWSKATLAPNMTGDQWVIGKQDFNSIIDAYLDVKTGDSNEQQ